MSPLRFPDCPHCGGARARSERDDAELACRGCRASWRITRADGGTYFVPLCPPETEPRFL